MTRIMQILRPNLCKSVKSMDYGLMALLCDSEVKKGLGFKEGLQDGLWGTEDVDGNVFDYNC